MTEYVTELVEIVHFFSIVTNFSVQAICGAKVFCLQIHLPSRPYDTFVQMIC